MNGLRPSGPGEHKSFAGPRYVKEGEQEREEIVYGVTNPLRRESERRSSACITTSPLAHRKSSPLPSGCHR
jgi:hypothetical protein